MQLQGAGFEREQRSTVELLRKVVGKSIRIRVAQAKRSGFATYSA